MQELEWPQDFAIKQMISLTCLLGQINIKNLCRFKSKLLTEVWTTAGLLRHWWWANILLQMKLMLTVHSEGWEWWGELPKLFLHEPVTNETCHSSPVFCTVCFPCLVSSPPGRYTAAFRDLPAIQYFSRSLLNDKYILETEMSFLCHNAKGNRNLQCASCKYTQCEEQF